ncbi:hypothetical protein VTH82DRAFT_5889 [Thermothelomyces myriococcoides]
MGMVNRCTDSHPDMANPAIDSQTEQPQYNTLEPVQVERDCAQLYHEVWLGLTVFSPMRQGILSGECKSGIEAPKNLTPDIVKEDDDILNNKAPSVTMRY